MAQPATPAATAVKPKPTGQGSPIQDRVMAWYYGDPGTGKTVDLAHAAKLGKIVYIDAENRLKSGVLRRLGIPVDNIDRRTGVSFTMLEDLVDELDDRVNGRKGEPLAAIAWDSLTETSSTLLGDARDASVQKALNAGKDRKSWSTEIGDYGDLSQQMRIIIRGMRDLGVHMACSALAKRGEDENGEVRISPELTPGVLKDVRGYMDVIMYTSMELFGDFEEYRGLTRPFGRWEAKDSFGVFPRYLVFPTFDRVVAYAHEKINRDTDPVQIEARKRREPAVDKAAKPERQPAEAAAS